MDAEGGLGPLHNRATVTNPMLMEQRQITCWSDRCHANCLYLPFVKVSVTSIEGPETTDPVIIHQEYQEVFSKTRVVASLLLTPMTVQLNCCQELCPHATVCAQAMKEYTEEALKQG